MARLGDVCIQITDGSHNPPTSVEKSKYLMISSKNIDDDCITLNNPRYLSKEDFDTENKRTNIEPGDLLMTIVGTIGRVAIMPNSFTKICVQRSVAVLKPKSDIVYNRFLMYYLQSMRPYLEGESRGVAQKGIYLKQIGSLTIFLPPLDEQRKIAAVLDKVSDLIAKRRQQLDKLDMLVKARFVEMFGAFPKDIKLSEVATITGGLTKNSNRKNLPLKLPYLRVANVAFNSVDVSEILEIGLTEEERKKTLLQKGDLLFVEGNGSPDQIGRVAVWNNQITPCVHQNHLIKARFDNSIVLPAFALHYYMNSEGRQQIREKAVSTSGLYTLSVSKIESLVLPTPPMELQEQFSTFVEQTDKSKLSIQKSCEKLETLKKALMQQYFG